jgi:hypothetical protein
MMEWFRGRKAGDLHCRAAGHRRLVAVMTLYKLEYPVKAEGKWMPVEQHGCICSLRRFTITRDGIRIPPDQLVRKGDVLIVLENR